ncbi:MAG: hypothetical protein WDW38_006395 [Sanguina aurantia]
MVAVFKARFEGAVKAYMNKLDPRDFLNSRVTDQIFKDKLGTSAEYWDLPILEILVLVSNGWFLDAHHCGMWNVVKILSPRSLGTSRSTGAQKYLVVFGAYPCIMYVKEFLDAADPEVTKRMSGL